MSALQTGPPRPLRQQWSSSEMQCPCTTAGAQLQSLTIDDSTNHFHIRNFDFSLKGRAIFWSDNTNGKLLKTDHGTFETTDFRSTYTACTRFLFAIGLNERNFLVAAILFYCITEIGRCFERDKEIRNVNTQTSWTDCSLWEFLEREEVVISGSPFSQAIMSLFSQNFSKYCNIMISRTFCGNKAIN